MRKRMMTAGMLAATMALTACGGGSGGHAGGVQAPADVAGTWGADCSQPFVKFDGGKVTVFPDKATYDLTSAASQGGQVTVGYTTAQGAVSEVYVEDGPTLRLDHGTYAGTDATWHKAPMTKCS
jgi:hypothetical protein